VPLFADIVPAERILASVNTDVDYYVFLTPAGNCNGLYVASKTATSFEVRDLRQGKSNISFDYRIMAATQGLRKRVQREALVGMK